MMIIMMYEFCALAYPFACLYGCVCGLPPLQWSSILLMWADARTPSSGIYDRDVAAWWTGRVLGPFWGPSLKNLFTMFSLSVLDSLLLVR